MTVKHIINRNIIIDKSIKYKLKKIIIKFILLIKIIKVAEMFSNAI